MEAGAYQEFADQEQSHWWFMGRRDIFRSVVERVLEDRAGLDGRAPRILDLGCGTGGMLDDLAHQGQVIGLDMEPVALQFCQQRGHRQVLRAQAHQLPISPGTLDLVCAFDTLEHMPEEQQTLAECFRSLTAGGHLVISVPAYQWLYTNQDRLVHHQRRYTAGALRRKLRQNGFEVLQISYINFFLFPVILPVVLLMKAKQALIKPPEEAYFTNASIRIPRALNWLLYRIFSAERHVLAHASVPAGHSLLAVARKPARKKDLDRAT